MKGSTFRFYYRSSDLHHNSVFKIEVRDGNKWLNGDDLAEAYNAHPLTFVGGMLNASIRLLEGCGFPEEFVPRLLSRKQVHWDVPCLPLDVLKNTLGWDVLPYPEKFGTVKDTKRLYIDAYERGTGFDVSNIISSPCLVDTQGLAFKGIIDKFDSLNIRQYLYIDHSTWHWIRANGLWTLFDYLQSFYDGRGYAKIVTSQGGQTADELMMYWANKARQPQITRDELDEFDVFYPWLLHGAERGEPRIHKFFRKSHDIVSIPDFGLDIEIPWEF